MTSPHTALAHADTQVAHPVAPDGVSLEEWVGLEGPALAPLERMLSEVFVEALDNTAGGARWVNLLSWLEKLAAEGPIAGLEVAGGQVAHYVDRLLELIDSRGMRGAQLESSLASAFPTAVARARAAGVSPAAGTMLKRDRSERIRPPPPLSPRSKATVSRTAAEVQFRRLRAEALRRHQAERGGDGAGAADEVEGGLVVGPPDYPTQEVYHGNVPMEAVAQWPQTVQDVLQYIGCRRAAPTNSDFVYLTRSGGHPWVPPRPPPLALVVSFARALHVLPRLFAPIFSGKPTCAPCALLYFLFPSS